MAYTVGEAAKVLDVSTSTLRYYESEGLLPTLGRTDGGQRLFEDQEIGACRVIACLKQSGLSIKDIKRFMDMAVAGDETLADRLALFQRQREATLAQIADLQQVLAMLDFKCWYYQTAVDAGTEDVVRDLPDSAIPAQHRAARARLDG